MVVEILSPEKDSPIAGHVKRGGGPYHFCYAVPDMDAAIDAAQQNSAKVVVAPVPDVAFDGRRVAFLFHEAHGIFELVEAIPKLNTDASTSSAGLVVKLEYPGTGSRSVSRRKQSNVAWACKIHREIP